MNSSQGQNSPVQSASPDQNIPAIDTASAQKAIDFTLTGLDGKKVNLNDLKGKSEYINFWTTWYPWCVKELPDIEKIYQEYKDKGLVVLAVDMGEDKDTVQSFIAKNNYHFDVLPDSNQRVAQAYGISSIPVSIFINKDGNIVVKLQQALW